MTKKIYLYTITAFFIFVSHIVIYKSSFVENFDFFMYDFIVNISKPLSSDTSSNVVIVDIDEKSLKSLGQWPWPRIILAELIQKIDDAKASAIGIDILFPEEDRTSLANIQKFYKESFGLELNIKGLDHKYFDNDKILAEQIKSSKSVLSYYLSSKKILDNSCQNIYSVDIDIDNNKLPNYLDIMCNSDTIQKASLKQGFVNKYTDSDGVLRKVPLIAKYKDEKVVSLPLATLLSIDDTMSYSNSTINVLNHNVQLSKNSSILLHYYSPQWYEKVSAIDLLTHEEMKKKLFGKIVLIGSSSVALHDRVIIPQGREFAGVQVNATIIANILDESFIVQPENYKLINMFISFMLSIFLAIILIRKKRIWIVYMFLMVFIFSSVYIFIAYYQNYYISIGYLLLPFLIHFFIINLLSIVIEFIEKKMVLEELNKSQIALFDSMVHVAEAHDLETGGHIIRTKNYVKIIAENLYKKGLYQNYLTPKKISIMHHTSALHDIGKVGISDLILKKEGKLDDNEFKIMKTHSRLGKNIIDNAISSYKENDFFTTARNIVYYHHEKFDGSGYPKGLKGEEIPLEARIMALADVYDALMSKRVYKKAFTYEKTKQIIISGVHEHFDPVIVEAFLSSEEEFKKVSSLYIDK